MRTLSSKVCPCEHKPTFELHGRTLLSYAPACTVFRGSLPFTPGAVGRAPSFWLPLAGYARQHPERQEWRAVPALNNKMIYVDFVEEGMAEGFDWTDTILNNILFNLK